MKKIISIMICAVFVALIALPANASVSSLNVNPYYPIGTSPDGVLTSIFSVPYWLPHFSGKIYHVGAYNDGNGNPVMSVTPIASRFLSPMGGISSDNSFGVPNYDYDYEYNEVGKSETSGNLLDNYVNIASAKYYDDDNAMSLNLCFYPFLKSGTARYCLDYFNGILYTTSNYGLSITATRGTTKINIKGTLYGVGDDTVALRVINEQYSYQNITEPFNINDIFNQITGLSEHKFVGEISFKRTFVVNYSNYYFTYEKATMVFDDGVITTSFEPTSLIKRIDTAIQNSENVTNGTLTVNSAGTHNVSGYEYINVDIPPYSLYYNGDIANGTYENSTKWNGVDISILMDIGNTFERGKTTTITKNGDFNIGKSEYVNIEVPQEVIEDVNAFSWFFGAVNGVLTMELMPGFSLGGILLFIAGLALLVWILKIFLGG